MSAQHHQHLSVRHLQDGRHHYPDLAHMAINNSHRRGSQLTQLQQTALNRYRREPIFPTENMKFENLDNIVLAYGKLFNELFGGYLKGPKCKVRIGGLNRENQYGRATLRSHLVSDDGIFNISCLIELFEHPRHENYSPRGEKGIIMTYISGLLHEMCHAFLQIYGCRYKPCWEKQQHRSAGHGFAWMDMAYVVKAACQDRNFLNRNIRIHLGIALRDEMRDTDYPIPEVRSWGFRNRDLQNRNGELIIIDGDSE